MHRPEYPSQRGFSLVEVTLALGLIAFGVIALMGILPTGLNLVRESENEAVALNIAMAINADVQSLGDGVSTSVQHQIPVGAPNTGKAYFNQHGKWLGNNSTYADAVYVANWDVRKRTPLSPPTLYITVAWPAQAATPAHVFESLIVLPQDPM